MKGAASGINNAAATRVAQLAGMALASGVAAFGSGYQIGFTIAAAVSIAGALVVAVTISRKLAKANGT